MDDLESALFSVWGYSNYIFCLPRGCPMQYSLLSHILHYSREGALSTVFCTANMQKANSRFSGSERESRNMTHIWRTLVPTWVNSWVNSWAVDMGIRVLPAPTFQGSALATWLLYEGELVPTLAPAQSQGPSPLSFSAVQILILFWKRVCIYLQERMSMNFQ